MTTDNDSLAREREAQRRALQALERSQGTLTCQADALKLELERATGERGGLQGDVAGLRTQEADLRRRLSQSEAALQSAVAERNDSRTETRALQRRVSALQDEVGQMQEQEANSIAARDQLQLQLHAAHRTSDSLKAQLAQS